MNGLAKQKNEHPTWVGESGPALVTRPLLLQTRVSLFQRAPIFRGLSPADCMELAAAAQLRLYRKGEPVFRHGEAARSVLVLATGQVKIMHLSRGGKEVILRVDGPGDILTTPGKPKNAFHSHSAFAIEPSHVLAWDCQVFEQMEKRFSSIRTNSVLILNERLRMLETSFLELATEQVTQRLAGVLLRLLESRGLHQTSGARIDLTNEQLAQMIGTTLFTVSRLLSEWEAQGIVATQRKSVTVVNLPALRMISELMAE